MSPIAERQMDKSAPLVPALMCQDDIEFRWHALLYQGCQSFELRQKLVGLQRHPRRRLMDDRAMDMIVKCYSKQLAIRIAKAKDAQVEHQRSGDRHQK